MKSSKVLGATHRGELLVAIMNDRHDMAIARQAAIGAGGVGAETVFDTGVDHKVVQLHSVYRTDLDAWLAGAAGTRCGFGWGGAKWQLNCGQEGGASDAAFQFLLIHFIYTAADCNCCC
jgi:hypothetical protein